MIRIIPIQTTGGNTLTRVHHSGPPPWDSGPPFTLNLYNYDVTPEFANSAEPSYHTKANIARGRRVWELTFSYLSSDDLFSVNELMSRYNPSTANSGSDFAVDIMTDSSFFNTVLEKSMGGALPFIFQPDNSNNSPDQFAICIIDQSSIDFEQVAPSVYNISLTIREIW